MYCIYYIYYDLLLNILRLRNNDVHFSVYSCSCRHLIMATTVVITQSLSEVT